MPSAWGSSSRALAVRMLSSRLLAASTTTTPAPPLNATKAWPATGETVALPLPAANWRVEMAAWAARAGERWTMSLDKEALSQLGKDGSERAKHYETRGTERRRRWVVGAAVIAIALVTWLVLGRDGPVEVEMATAQPPPAAGTSAVLNASGYVVARRMATVSARVTGPRR